MSGARYHGSSFDPATATGAPDLHARNTLTSARSDCMTSCVKLNATASNVLAGRSASSTRATMSCASRQPARDPRRSDLHTQYDAYGVGVAFVFGLLYGAARVATGSLVVPLVLHGLNNLGR